MHGLILSRIGLDMVDLNEMARDGLRKKKKHEQKLVREAEKGNRKKTLDERRLKKLRRELLIGSLGGKRVPGWVNGILSLPMLAWFAFALMKGGWFERTVAALFESADSGWSVILASIIWYIGPIIFWFWLMMRISEFLDALRFRNQRKQLESLPFAFNTERYETFLSEPRYSTRVRMLIEFRAALSDEVRRTVELACSGFNPANKYESRSSSLAIESPELPSSWQPSEADGTPTGKRQADNKAVHAWFRPILLEILPALHRSMPIKKVTFERIGDTNWDDEVTYYSLWSE